MNTSDKQYLGKYTLQSQIYKDQCLEPVEYEVTINTPPTINLPTDVYIYEDIKTKINWDETNIFDVDGNGFLEVKLFEDKIYTNPCLTLACPVPVYTDNLQKLPTTIDWDPNGLVMTVLDPTPTVYDLNVPPLPDKYYMGVKVTDQLDAVSFHYFRLHILPNSPPITLNPAVPQPPLDARVHNLTSGQNFAFSFDYDFFIDPDSILTNIN